VLSDGAKKLRHGVGEGGGRFEVEDVAAIQGDEARVWPSRGHLFALVLSSDSTVAAAKEKGRAVGCEPIAPMVAADTSARVNDLFWFKGELPAGGCFAEGVFEVGRESRANAVGECFACWELTFPCEYEFWFVCDDDADVFDDEPANFLWMPRGKLVGVDAAEGVAEDYGVVEVKVIEEGFQIVEIIISGVAKGVVGVAVAALVERDDTPFGGQSSGEGRECHCFHDVCMERDECPALASRVEVGELQAAAGEGASFHDGHDTKLHGFYRAWNHAWYGWWKTGVVCLLWRWEN
jgi:hypothetical protein